jgi:hypothetical protein
MAVAVLCFTAARADDWPFASPSPSAAAVASSGKGLPVIRHGKRGRFAEGEIEGAIAALKPGDYYEQNVPKLAVKDMEAQAPTMVGQVIKLKWTSREPALQESTDGSSMPEVQLRQDEYDPRGDFIGSFFASVKVPPDGMDFVKRIDPSKVIIWDRRPHEYVAYALILKGGKAVLLGHEITEPTPSQVSKFVW